jgi:hypothetical protein
MARQKSAVNPFYILLVIVGVVFFVTATAYGVMALRGIQGAAPAADQSGAGLLKFLDQHGELTLAIEVILLGLATFGAMATDQYWQSRPDKRKSSGTRSDDGSPHGDGRS